MAGFGAAINTGSVGRGDSVAVIGCGGVGNAAIAGASLVGATKIIAVDLDDRKLEAARGFGATHTVNSSKRGPDRGDPRTHRRLRRRRGHRGGRPAGDLRAGLLRPRPRGHGRARRGADARQADHPAAPRRVRPRRCAEVELVRRLPALAATSRCSSTSTGRAASTWTRSSASGSASATSRRRSTRCTPATCCARSSSWTAAGRPTSGCRCAPPREACGSSGSSPPGLFELDGGSWEVDNNVWLVGDDREVLVVDAAHDADAILAAVGDRRVVAIVCTHGHNDHVDAVGELVAATGATASLHPDDRVLWDQTQPEPPGAGARRRPGARGRRRRAHGAAHAGARARARAASSRPRSGVLLSGDTLFHGGPGATGRSYSDFPTIVESIRTRLLGLPPETVVLTGHGDPTTIGAEAPHLAGVGRPRATDTGRGEHPRRHRDVEEALAGRGSFSATA